MRHVAFFKPDIKPSHEPIYKYTQIQSPLYPYPILTPPPPPNPSTLYLPFHPFSSIHSVGSYNLHLKYYRFIMSGCKDINNKFEFVAKTQFLSGKNTTFNFSLYEDNRHLKYCSIKLIQAIFNCSV